MPSSNVDLINSALHNALGKKKKEQSEANHIENLHASSKQIFLHDIEFEKSHAPHSFVLNNLKSKYVTILSKKVKNVPGSNLMKFSKNEMSPGANSEDRLEQPRITLWPADKVTLGWRKNFPAGAGFINLGNTCYMNSSLQALFHIPSFVNWLLEEVNMHLPDCEGNSQNASFCSICSMMRTLRSALDRGNTVMKPNLIHNKLKCIGKTLMYGRQEDAHEFIKMLINHMEKSFLMYKRALKLDHRSKETTPLNQIFGGYLRQQVACPLCSYVSTTFFHFQDIVLDIKSVGSVDEALGLYFRKETLDKDNAYKCEKCKKRVPATKRHLIEKAPHVLLLQLKRFTFSGGKITKHINIQKTIDITKFVSGSKHSQPNGGGSYVYKLVSMVIHLGSSQHGGHYTAVAEASNNTMFEFDDASVRPISVQSALLRNPYILFYELIRKPNETPKQIIRQNSEKVLPRPVSCENISNRLTSSMSANSMIGRSSGNDHLGQPVSRTSPLVQAKKSPLPSQKERERVSFGIKTHSKTSSISSPSKSGSNSTSKSNFSNGTTDRNGSSLVPYNDDSSDDSSDDDSKKNLEKSRPKHLNGNKVNGSVKFSDRTEEKGAKMNGKTSFLPRSLQVQSNSLGRSISGQGSRSAVDGKGSTGTKDMVKSDENLRVHAYKDGWIVTEGGSTSDIKKSESKCNGWIVEPLDHTSKQDDSNEYKTQNGFDKNNAKSKSKESIESEKHDKSGRSMKKSLFSLFPCVMSSQNKESSPQGHTGTEKLSNPILSDVKGSSICSEQQASDKSDSECSEDLQSKRNRDDTEPTSPSKKYRPERSKNGLASSKISPLDKSPISCSSPPNGHRPIASLPNGESEPDSSGEEKYICIADNSKHKSSRNGSTSDFDSRKSVNVVQWNRNVKDLSDRLSTRRHQNGDDGNGSKGVNWVGNSDMSVVNSLNHSARWRFGTKISTWDGDASLLDAESVKARNESTKRTADDLYNDEIDEGRVRKHSKMKISHYPRPEGNPFQRLQNQFNDQTSPSSNPNQNNSWRNNGNYHNRKFNNYSGGRKWHGQPFPARNHYKGNYYNPNKSRNRQWHYPKPGRGGGGYDSFKRNDKFQYRA